MSNDQVTEFVNFKSTMQVLLMVMGIVTKKLARLVLGLGLVCLAPICNLNYFKTFSWRMTILIFTETAQLIAVYTSIL